MSWLDNEMRKLRQQEEQRRQQEEIQWKNEEQARKQRDALYQQRQQQLDQMVRQQLTSNIDSLQVRQLLYEAKRHWRSSSFAEHFNMQGNAGEFNEPLQLTSMYYDASLEKTHSYEVDTGRGHTKSSITTGIRVHLWGVDPTQIRIKFEVQNLYTPTWEEIITLYNHSELVARLKTSIAQAILTIQKGGLDR